MHAVMELLQTVGLGVLASLLGTCATVAVALLFGASLPFLIVWFIWLVLVFGGILIIDTDWFS